MTGEWTEATKEARDIVSDFYVTVAVWCFEHQTVTVAGIAAVVLGASAFIARNAHRRWLRKIKKTFRLRRGKEMKKGEYNDYVRIQLGYAVTDGIENAVAEGRISVRAARRFYKRMAYSKILDGDHILPRTYPPGNRLTPEEAEACLKILFNKKRMNIPGPKPGEVDNVVIFPKSEKKNTFGDKVRRHV